MIVETPKLGVSRLKSGHVVKKGHAMACPF